MDLLGGIVAKTGPIGPVFSYGEWLQPFPVSNGSIATRSTASSSPTKEFEISQDLSHNSALSVFLSSLRLEKRNLLDGFPIDLDI
jgi:hypothetical protein